jgi:hypothetical protein
VGDFLIVQVVIVGFDGYCLGLLLSYLIPADPATLPRVGAWLQATKDPKPDSTIPVTLYRWGMSLMAVVILAYTQYLMVSSLILFPTWALAYGSVRYLGFAGVDVLLLAWAAFVGWVFRRAASRTKQPPRFE